MSVSRVQTVAKFASNNQEVPNIQKDVIDLLLEREL